MSGTPAGTPSPEPITPELFNLIKGLKDSIEGLTTRLSNLEAPKVVPDPRPLGGNMQVGDHSRAQQQEQDRIPLQSQQEVFQAARHSNAM